MPVLASLVATLAAHALSGSALPRAPLIAHAARSGPLRLMHSDSRPTAEYFDFLLGRNQREETEDCPSIIVGDGRIGGLLAELGQRRGYDDILLRRGDPIPELRAGGQLVRMPIYICTRNDDLEAVIGACPEERREDLVFLQNGQLEPIRQRYGLYETTQAVLWLAAMRKGGKALDGITDENPEGLTTVFGKWSGALAMRLGTGDLTCNVMNNDRDLRRNMLEKMIWICSYMLVGAVHGGVTVGEVESNHREEVDALVRELAAFVRFTLSVALKTGLEDRLAAYSRQVEFFPTSLKEFEVRARTPTHGPLLISPHPQLGGCPSLESCALTPSPRLHGSGATVTSTGTRSWRARGPRPTASRLRCRTRLRFTRST